MRGVTPGDPIADSTPDSFPGSSDLSMDLPDGDEKQEASLLGDAGTVGSWILVSRVVGFGRDILMAAVFGTGMLADAFFVAFKLPNLFRRLFAEGAFNNVFIPLYGEWVENRGRGKAQRFAEDVASALVAALMLFTVAALLLMPLVIRGLAPGFADTPGKLMVTIELGRLTFPYLMFIALGAMLGGMLNTFRRFAAAAQAPILLNIFLVAVLVLAQFDLLAYPAHSLAWGVAAAGIGQFLWLVLACRGAGLLMRIRWPRLTEGVRLLLRRMVPGIAGAGLYQLGLLIDIILASLLPEGSVSYLYYADRVAQLPVGMVGAAFATALLPRLTRSVKREDAARIDADQNRALEFSLLLGIPASLALIAIAGPVVETLFGWGAFTPAAATATTHALVAFTAGIPAYVLIKTLSPMFFARDDLVTPVRIMGVCLVVNVAAAVVLMQFWAHVGLAAATALSSWLNAGALFWFLLQRGDFKSDARLRRTVPRILAAAVGMTAVLWGIGFVLAEWLAGPKPLQALGLVTLVVGGLVAFFFAAARLGIDLTEIRALFALRRARG